jgi:hypothetical protein
VIPAIGARIRGGSTGTVPNLSIEFAILTASDGFPGV